MSGEACPLPTQPSEREEQVIRRLLGARRIAVVGASDDPARAGNYVPEYLKAHVKEILPVNPTHEMVLGMKCYKSLAEVPGPVDLVNVFRRPAACAEVAEQAVAIGAKGIWLQSGIANEQAKQIAQKAGIDFVQDRCIMMEHRRHRG